MNLLCPLCFLGNNRQQIPAYAKIISFIRRKKFAKVLNNRTICKYRQAFTITNNMASLDLWKMLYFQNLFLPQKLAVQGVTPGAMLYDTNMMM